MKHFTNKPLFKVCTFVPLGNHIKLACLLLFFGLYGYSQKASEQVLENAAISHVFVDTDKINNLVVTTTTGSAITIKSWFEGEYANKLYVTTKTTGNYLTIGASFEPLFEEFDDKLAAHKIQSISVEICIPVNKHLIINGSNTQCSITGAYTNVQLFIHTGNVLLNSFTGNGTVKTFSGTITVQGYGGKVKAASDYGTVLVNTQVKNRFLLDIHTVKGNITVNKSK